MVLRAVGQYIDQARNAAVDLGPLVDGRPLEPGRMRDGREVQEQVRRSAERGVQDHRVADRGIGHDAEVLIPRAARATSALRTAAGHVEPDRLAGGGQGRVRQGQAQRLANHLGLAAVPKKWQPPPGDAQDRHASWRACSNVTSPRAKRAPIDWTFPVSSRPLVGSVTPPGISTQGRSRKLAKAIIIAGNPLSQVATPRTPLAVGTLRPGGGRPKRRRCGRPSCRTCRTSPGSGRRRVGAVGGIGNPTGLLELPRCRCDCQAELEVARMVAQRHGRAVLGPQPPQRAQDDILRARTAGRIPTHAGILRHAEGIAAGPAAEHLAREWQLALRPSSGGDHLVQARVTRIQQTNRSRIVKHTRYSREVQSKNESKRPN